MKKRRKMISDALCEIIVQQRRKEEKSNIWTGSRWEAISRLENNNVGIVGEKFVQSLCSMSGIESKIDGVMTKESGGGRGDGIIKGKSVEIKCARQSIGKGQSFQHELGEVPWNAEYMCFVDISPKGFYLSLFPNLTEDEYKSGSKTVYFPTRSVCWRKRKGAFKLDTTVKINTTQAGIENPNTMIWCPETDIDEVRSFIDRIIN